MEILQIDKKIKYTGHQLKAHWIYNNFHIKGNAIVSFVGPCDVKISEMVDLLDVIAEDSIYSPKMLHFICEFFDSSLTLMIFRQRLFITCIKEEIEGIFMRDKKYDERIIRDGDDIYISNINKKGKLTVSIATSSVVSNLMHTGVNIETKGTPVPTRGLLEIGVNEDIFAKKVMERFKRELKSINFARCKVRGV